MATIKTIGISGHGIKNIPGATKWASKNDIDIKAYFIPKHLISYKFYDEELQKPGIYFLVGSDLSTGMTNIYVGKAGLGSSKLPEEKRTIMRRLNNHRDKASEYYYDLWDSAIAFVSTEIKKDETTGLAKTTSLWELTEISNIENLMYHEINKSLQTIKLNSVEPNLGGEVENSEVDYDRIIKAIKSFLLAMGIGVFVDTDVDKPIEVEEDKEDLEDTENINKYSNVPEYITPKNTVKKMVDEIPRELFNPDFKVIDLACKGGEYLKEIYDRLMNSPEMINFKKDKIDRHSYIISKQIYGIAQSELSLRRTETALHGIAPNVKVIDNYINYVKGYGYSDSCKDFKQLIDKTFKTESGDDLKFDVVIGNPPYQEKTGSGLNESGGTALFDKFILRGGEISSRIVCMITPTKWMAGTQSNFNELRRKLTYGNHIRKMVDYFNPYDIFPKTQIAGGVSYFVYDREYEGTCEFISNMINTTFKSNRHFEIGYSAEEKQKLNIDTDETKIIPRFHVGEIVYKNVLEAHKNYTSLEKYIRKNLWQLPTNFEGNYVESENDIQVITPRGNYYYNRNNVPNESIDSYKVMFTRVVNGSTFLINSPKQLLSTINVIGPGYITNGSYMVVAYINNADFANNIAKYLKTEFTRFMLLQTLFGIGLTRDRFKLVPMQDFTNNSDIDWSKPIDEIDKQLYDKYLLNTVVGKIEAENGKFQEITAAQYIEQSIAPME